MSMKQFFKALTVASTLFGLSSAANAQDNTVVLKSFDQNFEVTGELLGFDDEFFNVRTAIGDLNVGREFVECSGAACPGAAEAPAEDDGIITLAAGDGTEFTGTLLNFDGVNYTLQTSIGVLTIRGEFVECSGAACPGNSGEAQNNSVKLVSGDGTAFEGELVDFDGTNYLLQTTLGLLTIRGEFVQCEGEACPDTGPQVAKFLIASPAGVGEAFIGEALSRFADEKSQSLSRSISDDGDQISYLIGDRSGNLIADITVAPADDIASIEALFSGEAAYALTRETFSAEDIARVTNMAVTDVSLLLNTQTIALDALTPFIHNTNPVRSISIDQMADILSGRISNWASVGGLNAPINVHFMDSTSNLSAVVQRRILAPRGLSYSSNLILHDSLEELNQAVSEDENGFKVSYRSDSAEHRIAASAIRTQFDTEGEAMPNAAALGTSIPSTRDVCNIFSTPDAFSLQTEEYPLTMRWNLYSLKRHESPDYANRFADYLQSDQGQAAAESAGLVSLAITQRPIREQGERLLSAMLAETVSNAGIRTYQKYLGEVSTGYRLSATMRFLTGTVQLDARSLRDWERVSKLISSGMMDGNNLILAGFSDSVGSFPANVNLSRSRAEYVKSVILQENVGILFPEDVLTFGFGPVAPVGCNATIDGRSLNRRVEVWIRGDNEVPLR